MNPVVLQVKSLYEVSKLSIAEIASELELEQETVKTILTQYNCVSSDDEVFTPSEYESAKRAIGSCIYSDDDNVRLRASKFIINEFKGRHDDLAKALKSVSNINVLVINQQLARAKKALEKSKTIDVEQIKAA